MSFGYNLVKLLVIKKAILPLLGAQILRSLRVEVVELFWRSHLSQIPLYYFTILFNSFHNLTLKKFPIEVFSQLKKIIKKVALIDN